MSLTANTVVANVVVTNRTSAPIAQIAGTLTGTATVTAVNVTSPAYYGDGGNLTGLGTGAISTAFTTNLAPSIALQTNSLGKIANSSVSATEISYLSGTTSEIQTQLDSKQPYSSNALSLANLSTSGNATCLNLVISGNASATSFTGNGALMTGGVLPTISFSNVQVSNSSGVVQTELALDIASGGYVVLNGSGFANSATSMLMIANTAVPGFNMTLANAATYLSSSRYLCQLPPMARGYYTAWFHNNSLVPFLSNAIRFSTVPTWTTAATLANVAKNAVFSTTLAATSDSAITYSNTTNLPGGVTLNANTGVLSGNIVSNTGTTEAYNFTVLAMDLELQKALRTFGLTATGVIATGGTITYSGSYKIHTFTSSGTFNAPGGSVEYLVIAGGGGGGTAAGGGGGAGGVLFGTMTSTVQAYSVTIGAGGPASQGYPYTNSPIPGGNGSSSQIVGVSSEAYGGGGGGTMDILVLGVSGRGKDGGSGGGGTRASGTPGTGTAGQGNSGGLGISGDGNTTLGGGGGSYTAVGGASVAATRGGNGAAGYTSSISGAAVTYAGGGGGGSGTSYVGGAGGNGGGGNGQSGGTSGSNATGYGSGGGGGGAYGGGGANFGGAGSSGIVIIRYVYI